jgi:hypothetical protein
MSSSLDKASTKRERSKEEEGDGAASLGLAPRKTTKVAAAEGIKVIVLVKTLHQEILFDVNGQPPCHPQTFVCGVFTSAEQVALALEDELEPFDMTWTSDQGETIYHSEGSFCTTFATHEMKIGVPAPCFYPEEVVEQWQAREERIVRRHQRHAEMRRHAAAADATAQNRRPDGP